MGLSLLTLSNHVLTVSVKGLSTAYTTEVNMNIPKLKRTKLDIRVGNDRKVSVIAYAIGDTGLFIHRILSHDLKQTDHNNWAISTASGYKVYAMPREPITRKELLNRVGELFRLQWDKPDSFWYTGEAKEYIDLASRIAMGI